MVSKTKTTTSKAKTSQLEEMCTNVLNARKNKDGELAATTIKFEFWLKRETTGDTGRHWNTTGDHRGPTDSSQDP